MCWPTTGREIRSAARRGESDFAAGRFAVGRLPFKKNAPAFGDSKASSVRQSSSNWSASRTEVTGFRPILDTFS